MHLKKLICMLIVLAFISQNPVSSLADAKGKNGVTVSGTVKVVKTRVKTSGAKSEKDVVVYLERKDDGSYPATSEKKTMDQKGLVFIPHVMAVQKGTTVNFLNSDNEKHNVFCVDDCCKVLEKNSDGKEEFMDLGSWGQGETRSYTFNIPGVGVLLCKLHPEMAAYIVVLETPYFTKAEIDDSTQTGSFSIENVPAGTYLVKTWNKKCVSEEQTITIANQDIKGMQIDITRKRRRR